MSADARGEANASRLVDPHYLDISRDIHVHLPYIYIYILFIFIILCYVLGFWVKGGGSTVEL